MCFGTCASIPSASLRSFRCECAPNCFGILRTCPKIFENLSRFISSVRKMWHNFNNDLSYLLSRVNETICIFPLSWQMIKRKKHLNNALFECVVVKLWGNLKVILLVHLIEAIEITLMAGNFKGCCGAKDGLRNRLVPYSKNIDTNKFIYLVEFFKDSRFFCFINVSENSKSLNSAEDCDALSITCWSWCYKS